MTNDEWNESFDALDMLRSLHRSLPKDRRIELAPVLHRYYLACCQRIRYLLPQPSIKEGLKGAEDFLDGKIDWDKLNELNRHAEAECFNFETDEWEEDIRLMIAAVPELEYLPYPEARQLMKRAAYFADRAIIFSHLKDTLRPPKREDFLCPKLLREFLQTPFDH